MFFDNVTADEPWSQPAVHHLYTRDNGIGEVHMCTRDVSRKQRGHHRYVHADAATQETHHSRLCADEPKQQGSGSER